MKIGLIAVGLNTYWHQFGGLRERLDGYRNAIKEKMEAYGGQIVADAGMVDDVDKAHAAAALFRRDEAEVLFIFISTYALSSTLIPFLGEGIPVVLLNLQPAPAIDYARLNGMSDRGEMTGEWLANCQACSLPEFCSVFNRAGTKYDVVTGYLDDAQAWAEIYGWIDAAKVACGMRRNRMGPSCMNLKEILLYDPFIPTNSTLVLLCPIIISSTSYSVPISNPSSSLMATALIGM